MSLKRAFFTVGGWTLLSRVVGFARDLLAANILGAGMAADAFFIALRLPNLFRRLFAEGAFTTAFVPLFTGALKESPAEGKRFAEEALAMLVAVLVPFSLLMMLFMPWVMRVITPGFSAEPEKFALAVTLSVITFPYLLLISLSALFGSILNARGYFGPYAAAPIAFNVVQIVALIFWPENPAVSQSWAVSVSGAVQLFWLALSMWQRGWQVRLVWPRLTPRIKRLFTLIGPSALAASVMQVNIFIDMVLASMLPVGAISYLSYADRFYQLPVGVIGIALGTAMLPLLSATLRSSTPEKALGEQNRAIEFSLYLAVPAAVGLMVVPSPILAVLYQHGQFTATVTHYTALALAAYAVSIPAYVVQKVLTAAFYAREDTKTPFLISMRTVVFNTLFSSLCIFGMKRAGFEAYAFAGLALATALTAWVNTLWLGRTLLAQGHLVLDTELKKKLGGIGLSAVLMVGVLLAADALLAPFYKGHGVIVSLLSLAALVGPAGLVYLVAAHLLGVQRLGDVRRLLRRRKAS